MKAREVATEADARGIVVAHNERMTAEHVAGVRRLLRNRTEEDET